MNTSNEIKKQILEGFIDIFTRIASKEFQLRVWINGEGSDVDSFDDAANDFFGECDSILEKHKDFGITNKQYHMLKNFRDQFSIFSGENHEAQEFIDTPEWEKIAEMAKDVLKAFNYKKVRK